MKKLLRCMSCMLALTMISPLCAQAEEETAMTEDRQAAIEEAIAQETAEIFEPCRNIPASYTLSCAWSGTIEEIHYTTRDYFGDGAEYTKRAYVYLPYGYTPEKQYKVLILCHGIGGSESEWGMTGSTSRVKNIMDNLIKDGVIEPFIVVTPNGRAGNMKRTGIDPNTSYQSFYLFGQELRNDLLPWIDEHYSTYGSGLEDLSASRDYRAMAGLSMGGMQTINIGLCECLDLFSWFGAFSAAPTSYTASQIASRLPAFGDQKIHCFYNICGLQDNIAYASASAAARTLPPCPDYLTEENWIWQEQSGGHDFSIWYLGFYNFAQIFGAR